MLSSIDVGVAKRMKEDIEFRREWFRAELEQGVPEMFRKLREERQLTQTELAEKVEMRQSAISRFEKSSEPKWKLETLLKIAEALDAQLKVDLVKSEDAIRAIEKEDRELISAQARIEQKGALSDQWSHQYIPRGQTNEIARHPNKLRDEFVYSWQRGTTAESIQNSQRRYRSLQIPSTSNHGRAGFR